MQPSITGTIIIIIIVIIHILFACLFFQGAVTNTHTHTHTHSGQLLLYIIWFVLSVHVIQPASIE